MKKSEFIERVNVDCNNAGKQAAIVAEKAGVTWDPELPELPERVGVAETGRIRGLVLFPESSGGEHESLLRTIAREAAARYNAMGRLLRPRATPWTSDDTQRVLEEEREKL